jgi:hypothetical protein
MKTRRITEYYDPEAPKRLTKPTKRVVKAALRLIKLGEINENGEQEIVVFDSKLKRKYRLRDQYVKDYDETSGHHYNYLNEGLLITLIFPTDKETDSLNLPRLPELVTRENLYPIGDFRPSSMRKLARSLERAVPIPSFASPFFA